MSLYAEYLKERENKTIIESENGFITYQIFDNGICYIQDIYVIPEMRKSGLTTSMQNAVIEIAKSKLCHTLIGSVCLDTNEPTRNLQILLNDGWQLDKIGGNMIFVHKKINGVV